MQIAKIIFALLAVAYFGYLHYERYMDDLVPIYPICARPSGDWEVVYERTPYALKERLVDPPPFEVVVLPGNRLFARRRVYTEFAQEIVKNYTNHIYSGIKKKLTGNYDMTDFTCRDVRKIFVNLK